MRVLSFFSSFPTSFDAARIPQNDKTQTKVSLREEFREVQRNHRYKIKKTICGRKHKEEAVCTEYYGVPVSTEARSPGRLAGSETGQAAWRADRGSSTKGDHAGCNG